jgi:hypothetical protein
MEWVADFSGIYNNNKTVNILEVKLRREDTYRGF